MTLARQYGSLEDDSNTAQCNGVYSPCLDVHDAHATTELYRRGMQADAMVDGSLQIAATNPSNIALNRSATHLNISISQHCNIATPFAAQIQLPGPHCTPSQPCWKPAEVSRPTPSIDSRDNDFSLGRYLLNHLSACPSATCSRSRSASKTRAAPFADDLLDYFCYLLLQKRKAPGANPPPIS